MYPVGMCLHILPDVLLHDYCRFLAEPSRQCLGAFGFYLNVSKLAGFRNRKVVKTVSLLKFIRDWIMIMATEKSLFEMLNSLQSHPIMLLNPRSKQASKQASKPLFITQ